MRGRVTKFRLSNVVFLNQTQQLVLQKYTNCICEHERHLSDIVAAIDAEAFKVVASNVSSLVQAVGKSPHTLTDNPALHFVELPTSIIQGTAAALFSCPYLPSRPSPPPRILACFCRLPAVLMPSSPYTSSKTNSSALPCATDVFHYLHCFFFSQVLYFFCNSMCIKGSSAFL